VERVRAGPGEDVGEAGGAPTNLCGHDARERLKFEHGIDVEVGKRTSAKLRIARISTVEGKYCFDATLPIVYNTPNGGQGS
jgi:hypothetical protein